jgi:hypothetical protein
MKKVPSLNFSAASPVRLNFVLRAKRRLMLGLTARKVRAPLGRVGEFAPAAFGSGYFFGSPLLDAAQPTLTRYHE